MKYLFTLLWFILISIGTILTSCTENKNPQEKRIREIIAQYQKAINSADVNSIKGLYAKDGMFIPTGFPSATGAEDIGKTYKNIFGMIKIDLTFTINKIDIYNDLAIVVTSTNGNATSIDNGNKTPESNVELFVLENIHDEWKISRYLYGLKRKDN